MPEHLPALARVQEAVPEMDVSAGISYCGGTKDFFLPVLEEYAANRRFSQLADFYAAEDWENYRILVHGLKTASLMVGLTGLSEQARSLELAVKEDDLPFLRQNHAALLAHYQDTVARLAPLFGG